VSGDRNWDRWFSEQKRRQVLLRHDHAAVIVEHRKTRNGGVEYYQGLSDEALAWCAERQISPPLLTHCTDTAGFILTFGSENEAFEFKMTWY
jgi:hypothetical protein